MKKICEKWKDQLLEAALTGAVAKDLEEHLRSCGDCVAELRALEASRARLDLLLPMVAQGSEPSVDFRARVIAAAASMGERNRTARWRVCMLAGATVTAAVVLAIGAALHSRTVRKIPPDELAIAQRLAEWHAPSDTLLATPGQEILQTTPKLGGSYLSFPANKVEEE